MIIHPFDPLHFTRIQTNSLIESANIQNGPKTTNVTEKADPTGKFDKFLILRGGGSYYNMVGTISF